MKLSTRSRYGTRMMLDLANHYDKGPVQIGEISRREGISVMVDAESGALRFPVAA